MSNCCSTAHDPQRPARQGHICPINKKTYSAVSMQTVYHHLKASWNFNLQGRTFYFCSDPSCDVVYFSNDDSVILESELRTKVGIKQITNDALICYCFGVTKADVIRQPDIKNFVIEQTKNKLCSCEIRNPSGKCCLKDFPKI